MSGISLSEFADKINEITPQVVREIAKRQEDELFTGKITIQQMLILDYLDNIEQAKMSDLAGVMNVTTAAMTGIINRLVKSGYVARAFDQDDRRIINVKTTSKGHELVKKIKEGKRQMIIKMFSKLPQQDRQDYLRILTQINNILKEENHPLK